ncbi:unnamed protein product [Closterium sp. NIES-64]|nr:unnamed protein product [Closterium sp. NIES-64]
MAHASKSLMAVAGLLSLPHWPLRILVDDTVGLSSRAAAAAAAAAAGTGDGSIGRAGGPAAARSSLQQLRAPPPRGVVGVAPAGRREGGKAGAERGHGAVAQAQAGAGGGRAAAHAGGGGRGGGRAGRGRAAMAAERPRRAASACALTCHARTVGGVVAWWRCRVGQQDSEWAAAGWASGRQVGRQMEAMQSGQEVGQEWTRGGAGVDKRAGR